MFWKSTQKNYERTTSFQLTKTIFYFYEDNVFQFLFYKTHCFKVFFGKIQQKMDTTTWFVPQVPPQLLNYFTNISTNVSIIILFLLAVKRDAVLCYLRVSWFCHGDGKHTQTKRVPWLELVWLFST